MSLPYLPLRPLSQGYASSERAGVVSFQKLRGGLGRARSDLSGATEAVTVKWRLRHADYEFFMAFYRSATQRGSLPFEVDLVLGSGDLERHKVFFVPGSIKLGGISGAMYEVSAQLEAYPNDYPAEDDEALLALIELYDGDVDELGEVVDGLEKLANEDLPA